MLSFILDEFLSLGIFLLTSQELSGLPAVRTRDHWGELWLAGMFPLGLSLQAFLLVTPLFPGA